MSLLRSISPPTTGAEAGTVVAITEPYFHIARSCATASPLTLLPMEGEGASAQISHKFSRDGASMVISLKLMPDIRFVESTRWVKCALLLISIVATGWASPKG